MTTTNGTRALRLAHDAREVVMGCFFNLSAVARYLSDVRGEIVLLCAGTEGRLSEDDVACAGAIAEKNGGLRMTARAEEAIRVWRRARRSLKRFLLESEGGVPLVRVGLERDARDCARRDRFGVVPRVTDRRDGYRIGGVRC